MRSFTIALTALLAAAFALAPAGCSKGKGGNADSLAAAKKAAATVVIKVNGSAISKLDVQQQEDNLVRQMRSFADSAQVASMMPMIHQQAIDNSINRILLEETLKRLNIQADKAAVDERIANYRKNFVTEEAFLADLSKQGLDAAKLRTEVELGVKAEELFKRRSANVPPATEAEARSFYDGNPDRFQQPERVRASHVLVQVNKEDTDAIRAEKRKKIEQVQAELKKGKDFAEVAKAYSDCPSKEQGGDLGYFEKGQMDPAFEKAAFELKTGATSGIVESSFGYHIIKVVDHQKPGATPFEQTKAQLTSYLTEQKKNQAIAAYFDSLRTASKIEYVDSTYAR